MKRTEQSQGQALKKPEKSLTDPCPKFYIEDTECFQYGQQWTVTGNKLDEQTREDKPSIFTNVFVVIDLAVFTNTV